MKPVFLSLKEFDATCDKRYGMQNEILMENAARGMCDEILNILKRQTKNKKKVIQIVCGSGDNGADGLALARMLYDAASVKVVQVAEPKSALCLVQTERLKNLNIPISNLVSECDILVDAFLGTGLNGTVRENAAKVINEMNAVKAYKIACDIPSGLNLYGQPSPVAFKAKITLSAGALKVAFFSDVALDFVGKIKEIGLGLPSNCYAPCEKAAAWILTKPDMQLPVRTKKNTHKGTFGHAVVYLGEKEGAAILASSACLRFGAGLVTVCGNKHSAVMPADLMYASKMLPSYSAYCVGPGLGSGAENIIEAFFKLRIFEKTVFDADALKTAALAKRLPELNNCILTPHLKEFLLLVKNLCKLKALNIARFESLTVQDIQERKLEFAKVFATQFPHVVLVLKGAVTVIAHGEKAFFATSGTPALAKAGSGDVLAGMLTALLAQGYDCEKAAITAQLAHGYASRLLSSYASTASDLIQALGKLESLVAYSVNDNDEMEA